MAEKQNTPEIRFEGFTDPWEQRKLGDLISVYIAHAGPEEDVTVLTSSRDGIQKQEDHFGRLQQHDTSDWNLIPYGYCTYRNRSDDGLFTFNVNKVADRGIVSKFYPVFETPECDADFLVAYLNSSQEIRKKLFVLAVGTSQVVLSYGALKELSLLLPQNREQSAIANVLNHIDNLITLHQRKYDKLCTVKKSMLDKMFPKPGETEPEIRFEGFTDPWEQRKLGDCFEFLKNNTLSRAGLNGENGTARNVHYGDILIKFGDCLDGERSDLPFITDDTVLPKFTGSILREGDVIFADTAEDEAAGKCVELRKLPKEPTISGLHTIPARPRFPFGTGYLGHYLNSDAYHRQLLPLMQGIKVISVSKASLQDTQVRFPGLSEQTAIGAALSEIDALITLHQRKLELLRNIKKSLLDRMFV